MNEEELKKYFIQIDIDNIEVNDRRFYGRGSKTVTDEDKRMEILTELIKSLLKNYPQIKEGLEK